MILCRDLSGGVLEQLLSRHDVAVAWVETESAIPGSHWGEPEAGILGSTLFVRPDTPVHSALHEACHLIVMSADRRRSIDTDAGGDDLEEEAVCVLQIVLADELEGVGSVRLMRDMDEWGYSFRLGSTRRFFDEDSAEARDWLRRRNLLDRSEPPEALSSSGSRSG